MGRVTWTIDGFHHNFKAMSIILPSSDTKLRTSLERLCPLAPHSTSHWCVECLRRQVNYTSSFNYELSTWQAARKSVCLDLLNRSPFVMLGGSNIMEYVQKMLVNFVCQNAPSQYNSKLWEEVWMNHEIIQDCLLDKRYRNLGLVLPGPPQWKDDLGGSLGLPRDVATFILDYCC